MPFKMGRGRRPLKREVGNTARFRVFCRERGGSSCARYKQLGFVIQAPQNASGVHARSSAVAEHGYGDTVGRPEGRKRGDARIAAAVRPDCGAVLGFVGIPAQAAAKMIVRQHCANRVRLKNLRAMMESQGISGDVILD